MMIKKNGITFNIIDEANDLYFAEQIKNNKLIGYEVGKLIKIREFGSTNQYQGIAGHSLFGMNKIDMSFPARSKDKAQEYYNKLNEGIIDITVLDNGKAMIYAHTPMHYEVIQGSNKWHYRTLEDALAKHKKIG